MNEISLRNERHHTLPGPCFTSNRVNVSRRVASRHHHTVSSASRNNTVMSVDQPTQKQAELPSFSNITSVLRYLTTSNRRTHDSPHSQRNNSTHCQWYDSRSTTIKRQDVTADGDTKLSPTSRPTAYKLSCPLYNQQRTHLCKIIKYQNQDSLTAYQNV